MVGKVYGNGKCEPLEVESGPEGGNGKGVSTWKRNEGGIFRAIGDHKVIIWGENEASVVHEMMHAVRYVMLSRGVGKMDENNDEIYAYTMGWLYKELVRDGE